jgi:hypothetical protein
MLEYKGVRITEIPENQLQKRVDFLQNQVLFNRACMFFASKLQEYERSEFIIISGIMTATWLFIHTIIIFSILYFGSYKIDPASFEFKETLFAFDYIRLSFNNMLFVDTSGIELNKTIPQLVTMYQNFLSLMLIAIFLSILITVRSRRHETELKETISHIESAGRGIEAAIVADYNYANIDEAIADLQTLQAAFAAFIVRLSNSIKPPSK